MQIQDFAKRNRLDAQAAVKLGEAYVGLGAFTWWREVMEGRHDVDGDLQKLAKRLEEKA